MRLPEEGLKHVGGLGLAVTGSAFIRLARAPAFAGGRAARDVGASRAGERGRGKPEACGLRRAHLKGAPKGGLKDLPGLPQRLAPVGNVGQEHEAVDVEGPHVAVTDGVGRARLAQDRAGPLREEPIGQAVADGKVVLKGVDGSRGEGPGDVGGNHRLCGISAHGAINSGVWGAVGGVDGKASGTVQRCRAARRRRGGNEARIQA